MRISDWSSDVCSSDLDRVAQVPVGPCELLVGPPSAGFEDADLVALLAQAQGTGTAAESRADDEYVVVVAGHGVLLWSPRVRSSDCVRRNRSEERRVGK